MENKDLLRRYLLGALSEREQEEMERKCTTNDALSEDLQAAESDLIDAYVCHELSPEERAQFEGYFLDSSEKQMRVEIANALMSSEVRKRVPVGPIVEEKSQPAGWRWLFSLGAGFAAAAAAVFMVFFLIQNHRLRNDLALSKSAQLERQNRLDTLLQEEARLPSPAPSESEHLPSVSVVSLMLSPGLLRNGGNHQSSVLNLPQGASAAVLMLRLEPASLGISSEIKHPHYDVVLESIEGKKLQTLRVLSPQHAPDGGTVIAARFPSQLLAEGDYLVTLLFPSPGGERKEVASYTFSVTR